MRTGYTFLSAIHLLISILFVGFGALIWRVCSNDSLFLGLNVFLNNHRSFLETLGLSLSGFGVLLIAIFSVITRKKSYRVQLNNTAMMSVDLDVFRGYVERFTGNIQDIYLDISGNLCVETEAATKEQFHKMEVELPSLLEKELGFTKEIFLKVMVP